MKTAGEVNAAILESLSQGREAKLVALLKLLQWGETLLEERAEFPKVRRIGHATRLRRPRLTIFQRWT
jgi:hypothetical protein